MTIRRIERVRAGSDLTVGQMTLTELQAEIRRRIGSLQKQRDELREKLEAIEHELETVGAMGEELMPADHNGRLGRKRMSADDYDQGVREVLEPGRAYTTTEICDALEGAGYRPKKSTLTQGMAAQLVETGVLKHEGRKGRANLYALNA